MKAEVREHILFEGLVQGVGFRYKISQLAGYYGLTGWVRNEYDGTVSAELQGRIEELDAVILCLSQDRYIRLDSIIRKKIRVETEEHGFSIRY